jgi:hypothetical protein
MFISLNVVCQILEVYLVLLFYGFNSVSGADQ